MTWQIFPNVTFTNGSKNIAVNDSTATAGILAGFAVNRDNKSYEIESVTSSAIILVDAWPEATASNVIIKIQPTSEPVKEYIQETLGEVKGLVANYLARLQLEESIISSTGTVPFTDSAGVSHDIPGWASLEAVALAKMQEFGLGALNPPNITDANTAVLPGFYRASGAGSLNFDNPNGGNYGMLLVERRGAQVQQTNTYFNSLSYRYSGDNGSTWTEWYQAFTTHSVEYGSNANGEYWKYPDGKLICIKKLTVSIDINVAWGSSFISTAANSGNIAHSFISAPVIGVRASEAGGNLVFIGSSIGATYTSFGTYYLMRGHAVAGVTITIDLTATGRWK